MSIHPFSLTLPKTARSATIVGGLPKMRHPISLLTILLAFVPAVIAGPDLRNAGATLVAESQPNSAIEPGENVTVRLALKNIGDATVSNLVATLQTNGVANIVTPSQSYGLLEPCAPSVRRDFTFTCTAPSNSLLVLTLALKDSDQSLGNLTFRFRVGPQLFYASTPASVLINSVGPADSFPSVLSVSNSIGTVVGVSVTLSNLSHTYPDDLDILLVSPGGDCVLLMSDACGGAVLDHTTLTFTDDAPDSLPDNAFPIRRTVRPTNFEITDLLPSPVPAGPFAGIMTAFNGKDANGDWKLFIFDDTPDDGGKLWDGWALTLTTLPVVDGAPTLILLGGTPNETIRFAVRGRPGYPYAIEASPDPLNYTHLESFDMPPSGIRIFEYPLGPQNRFFRAATDP